MSGSRISHRRPHSRLHHAISGIICEPRCESQVELQDGLAGCGLASRRRPVESEVKVRHSDIGPTGKDRSGSPADNRLEEKGSDNVKIVFEFLDLLCGSKLLR